MDKSNLGVDVDRQWICDGSGDLLLAKFEDNVTQAIFNRLSCTMDALDWIYRDYGSYVKDWIGKPNTASARESLLKEIEKRVKLDPRLDDCIVELLYYTTRGVGFKITGFLNETHEDFEEYFLFGVNDLYSSKNMQNNPDYEDTYIQTRQKGYVAKPGSTLVLHVHVNKKSDDDFVPIGAVSISVERRGMQIKEVQQSWGKEPGTVVLSVEIPTFFHYGIHDLTFTYHGAKGYNPCTKTVKLLVLPKLPTETHIHGTRSTLKERNEAYNTHNTYENTNEYDELYLGVVDDCTPGMDSKQEIVVHVNDYNGIPVGWDYAFGESAGKVELSLAKPVSKKVETMISVGINEELSYSNKHPGLIEKCIVRDVYGRPVSHGDVIINMWLNQVDLLAVASTDYDNLNFTVNSSLEPDKSYRLEDCNGNLVDTVTAVKHDNIIDLYSSDSEPSDVIRIN